MLDFPPSDFSRPIPSSQPSLLSLFSPSVVSFLVRLMSLFVRRPFPPISQTDRLTEHRKEEAVIKRESWLAGSGTGQSDGQLMFGEVPPRRWSCRVHIGTLTVEDSMKLTGKMIKKFFFQLIRFLARLPLSKFEH